MRDILSDSLVVPAPSLIQSLFLQGSASGSCILCVAPRYVGITMPHKREYVSVMGGIVHLDTVDMFLALIPLTLIFCTIFQLSRFLISFRNTL